MRSLSILTVVAAAWCLPVDGAPLDVTFTGIVVDTCTIAVTTPGVMVLSNDGTIMGSAQGLGVPATVTILSIGTNTVELEPPTLETYPPEYTPGDETLELNTTGLASNPIFTSLGLDFLVGLLPISELFVNLRMTNPDGFAQGIYTAKTVLTCS